MLLRNLLLSLGIIGTLLYYTTNIFTPYYQFVMFVIGMVIVGIPHGAADLLVSIKNETGNKKFSVLLFFLQYFARLIAFGLLLYYIPKFGGAIFIVFAAYHFGESDLYQFNTSSFIGKLLVTSYGLVLLSTMLIHHFSEVVDIVNLIQPEFFSMANLQYVQLNSYKIESIISVLFFSIAFIYFYKHGANPFVGYAFVQFVVLIVILYNLPLIAGFTFYFIIWHSLLSLHNIVAYLQHNKTFNLTTIVKQILLYSVIAILGTALIGYLGVMFTNTKTIISYTFVALALLTAPHLEIMHTMYIKLRQLDKV